MKKYLILKIKTIGQYTRWITNTIYRHQILNTFIATYSKIIIFCHTNAIFLYILSALIWSISKISFVTIFTLDSLRLKIIIILTTAFYVIRYA